jgi:hypothetical protein
VSDRWSKAQADKGGGLYSSDDAFRALRQQARASAETKKYSPYHAS